MVGTLRRLLSQSGMTLCQGFWQSGLATSLCREAMTHGAAHQWSVIHPTNIGLASMLGVTAIMYSRSAPAQHGLLVDSTQLDDQGPPWLQWLHTKSLLLLSLWWFVSGSPATGQQTHSCELPLIPHCLWWYLQGQPNESWDLVLMSEESQNRC